MTTESSDVDLESDEAESGEAATDTESPDSLSLWKATVIAVYEFEHAAIGDTCTVRAHTAFDAWRKAEPLLGVAKEHLALERIDSSTR